MSGPQWCPSGEPSAEQIEAMRAESATGSPARLFAWGDHPADFLGAGFVVCTCPTEWACEPRRGKTGSRQRPAMRDRAEIMADMIEQRALPATLDEIDRLAARDKTRRRRAAQRAAS